LPGLTAHGRRPRGPRLAGPGARGPPGGRAAGRRRSRRAAPAAGAPHRRARGAARSVRDEHARGAADGLHRLPPHALRRLALGPPRSRVSAGGGSLRPPRRRPPRAPGLTPPVTAPEWGAARRVGARPGDAMRTLVPD